MILLIDNYDSFTYNLVQRLGEINPELDIQVYRNDKITLDEIEKLNPSHLIVSPGPCTPDEAGISVEAIQHFAGKLPILGVCLGHQSMGQAFGAKIVRAERLMHGKTDEIHHDNQGLFAGMDNPFIATRYHSLLIQEDTLPENFEIAAWTFLPDGRKEIMAIRHKENQMIGLQFHPESFLSETGTEMLSRFITINSATIAN